MLPVVEDVLRGIGPPFHSHWSPALEHRRHWGSLPSATCFSSSHLTLRMRHVRQPARVCQPVGRVYWTAAGHLEQASQVITGMIGRNGMDVPVFDLVFPCLRMFALIFRPLTADPTFSIFWSRLPASGRASSEITMEAIPGQSLG